MSLGVMAVRHPSAWSIRTSSHAHQTRPLSSLRQIADPLGVFDSTDVVAEVLHAPLATVLAMPLIVIISLQFVL